MEIPEKVEKELKSKGGLDRLLERIKDEDMEKKSKLHKALSNKLRLKILALLKQQDLCVCLLKRMLDIEDSKLSYHLSVLKKEGLIEGKREASFVIYRITEKGNEHSPI